MDPLLTADVTDISPRFRRKSSTLVDAIHDLPEHMEMAPAQLYSTESGRLFHSGRIWMLTMGLPPTRSHKIVRKCGADIYPFLNHENGQIAIYDAVNPLSAGRKSLAKEFAKHDI